MGYFLSFFNWVLSTSVMATVLVVLILLVKYLTKNKLAARWQYILWFVLIFRLLLPWSPESQISIFNLFELFHYEEKLNHPVADTFYLEANSDGHITTNPQEVNQLSGSEQLLSNNIASSNLKNRSIFFVIWIIGTLSLMLYLSIINMRYVLKMKKSTYITNQEVLWTFQQCKESLNIKSSIPLIRTNEVKNPILFGCIRPKLLLPESALNTLSLNELRYIFLHELVHFKRKDIAVNWIMSFLLILHWFNPVLWYAYYRMREDQEMACDALALSCIQPNESTDYGFTIIKLLESTSSPLGMPGVASFSGNKSQIKRRITMIKLFDKTSYKWSILGLAIFLLLSGLALTNAKAEDTTAHTLSEDPQEEIDGEGTLDDQTSSDFKQTSNNPEKVENSEPDSTIPQGFEKIAADMKDDIEDGWHDNGLLISYGQLSALPEGTIIEPYQYKAAIRGFIADVGHQGIQKIGYVASFDSYDYFKMKKEDLKYIDKKGFKADVNSKINRVIRSIEIAEFSPDLKKYLEEVNSILQEVNGIEDFDKYMKATKKLFLLDRTINSNYSS